MTKLSFVIALYRSEKAIELVVNEIIQCLDALTGYSFEIILVNDCSPDNVLTVVMALAQKDKRIKIIDLAKNSGQPNAMMAAFRHTCGDYIICMDDDMQHSANAVPLMLDAMVTENADVVFAKYKEQKESPLRRLGSNINAWMAHIMAGKPKHIRSNSFFIMRQFVRDAMVQYPHNNPYIFGIIFATTGRIANVEVEHRERVYGKSNYSLKKLVGFWLNGFLNFSIKPLRVATMVGIGVSLAAAIWALFLLIDRILHPNVGVLGWTSLMVVITFFAGIQLICTGILGEYLGRLYLSQSRLPTYSVRNTVNFEEEGHHVD